LPGAKRDAGLLEFLESLQLGGHTIGAERKQRCAIQAAFVGDDHALFAGVDVGHGHGDAGQQCALIVFDRAFEGAVNRG
jgi:hypothetical protein